MNRREAIDRIAEMVREQMPNSSLEDDFALILAEKILDIGMEIILDKVGARLLKPLGSRR